jgi:signal transduction histidine kinase
VNIIQSFWDKQKLIGKYLSMLACAALLIAPIVYITLEYVLMPTFVAIETKASTDQNARAKYALKSFNDALTSAVKDYALWDPVYAYVDKPNTALENETLTPLSYQNVGVDVMAIVRFDGTVQWSNAVNRENLTVLRDETNFFAGYFGKGSYFDRAVKNQTTTDYVRTSRGLYAMHSTWVTKSDGSGTPRGYMAMGILLDEKAMSDALQVAAKLNGNIPAALTKQLKENKNHLISNISHGKITTTIGLLGHDNKVLGSINFSTPRSIYAAGRESVLTTAIALLFTLLVLIITFSIGLRRVNLSRLIGLQDFVQHFRESGAAVDPAFTRGSDEIAALARGFDALASDLREAEEQLRQSAYLQGKADSAAGMLHNVRNALAPVRVLQEKWVREEQLPFRENLKRALDELASPDIALDRKASLEQFVIAAARKITESSQTRAVELHDAQDSVDHIAAILGSYNFDTSANKAGDCINLSTLIAREIKQLSARTDKAIAVEVDDDLPEVMGNQVQLSQILGNLFVNSVEAMEASGSETMQLVIKRVVSTAPETIAFRISDNGEGIDAETLANIFERGFSTRTHKSGGIGLHWSANAMRAMGGSLDFKSDGKGHGATAILTLKRAVPIEVDVPLAA